MDCYSCKSLSGEGRISPGPTIFEGKYWVVEHAYPCSLEGWLVLVLKRHAEALHELGEEEFSELGELQRKSVRALHQLLDCEKEYLACFSEAEHFKHVHLHVVPKPRNLPPERIGPRIFAALQASASEAVPPQRIEQLCKRLQEIFEQGS